MHNTNVTYQHSNREHPLHCSENVADSGSYCYRNMYTLGLYMYIMQFIVFYVVQWEQGQGSWIFKVDKICGKTNCSTIFSDYMQTYQSNQ